MVTERVSFSDGQGREQRVAAYGVCTRDDPLTSEHQLLLVRLNDRTTTPGAWMLPGGGIEFGEQPADAVVREVEEETGYRVAIDELLTVVSVQRVIHRKNLDQPINYHAIRVIYRVNVVSGELRYETDNSTDEAAWCHAADLDRMRLTDVAIQARTLANI